MPGAVSRVGGVDSKSDPVSLTVYRIPISQLASGTWTIAGTLPASSVKYYQWEPGFKTNSYGNLQPWLPFVSRAFNCAPGSVSSPLYVPASEAGEVNNSDICGAVGLVQ